MNPETARLDKADQEGWKKWGPYISERQGGAVREDYSQDGGADPAHSYMKFLYKYPQAACPYQDSVETYRSHAERGRNFEPVR
jgi:hypothetical protein